MRDVFSFWWRCAKFAAKGNSAHANDWQWVVASPLWQSIGTATGAAIGGAFNSIFPGASPVIASDTWAGVLLGGLAGFIVTWLLFFVFRLITAPAALFSAERMRAEQALQRLEGIELTVQKVTFEVAPNEDIGDVHFVVRNNGSSGTTLHKWSLAVSRAGAIDFPDVPARSQPFPRLVPSSDGRSLLRIDDLENDPLPVGARREARYAFVQHKVIVQEIFGVKGTKFTLSCQDGRGTPHKSEFYIP